MNIFYRRAAVVFLTSACVFSIGGVIVFGKGNFTLKDIKVRVFDNAKNTVTDKETNGYGNGMDIFLSVLISQDAESENTYTVTVEGFGKGRDNEAEGTVEDYKVKESREIKLYTRDPIYIPFVLEYPCAEETNYTVTITQKDTGKKLTKTVKSPHGFCSLN
jgi:hypothetical protein